MTGNHIAGAADPTRDLLAFVKACNVVGSNPMFYYINEETAADTRSNIISMLDARFTAWC